MQLYIKSIEGGLNISGEIFGPRMEIAIKKILYGGRDKIFRRVNISVLGDLNILIILDQGEPK